MFNIKPTIVIPTSIFRNTNLLMRMVVLLITFFISSLSIAAQGINIKKNSASLKEVLNELRSQSGYVFFYSESVLKQSNPVDISLKNSTIQDALEVVFKSQPIDYEINGKTITIREAKVSTNQNFVHVKSIDFAGKVVDSLRNPISGASVQVKSKDITVKTDKDGTFRLVGVEIGDVMVISHVGYVSREIVIVENSLLYTSYVLRMNENVLDEVHVNVNTGFQIIDQRKMTGAATTIGSSELEKRYTPNVLDNLEGRIPGLTQYRGTTTIRGVSTIMSSQSPLVVVDGLPIEGTIADVNPYDIESVSVLKDAAAAAIYGVRATNGVIVVTTKRATEINRTKIDFSSNISLSSKPDFSYHNFATPAQEVELESNYWNWWYNGGVIQNTLKDTESAIATGRYMTPVQYAYYQLKNSEISQSQLDGQLAELKRNNFIQQYKDNALLNQLLQQYNLSARTSKEYYNSSLLLNYKHDNGGIINSSNKQINIYYKGIYNVNKWLDVDFGINTVIGKIKGQKPNSLSINPFNVPSYYKLLDESGNRVYYNTYAWNAYNDLTETTPNSYYYTMKYNHLDELGRDLNNTSALNGRYFLNLNVKLLPGLTFNPQMQIEDIRTDIANYSEEESYLTRYVKNIYANPSLSRQYLPAAGGRLANTNSRQSAYTARGTFNFDKSFDKHEITALAGMEFRETRNRGTRGLLVGYVDDLQISASAAVDLYTISQVQTTLLTPGLNPSETVFRDYFSSGLGISTIDTKHRYAAAFANFFYTYDRKYTVFGSARKDVADVFGLETKLRGKPLWSMGAAWNIKEESFMTNVNEVNYLKLRGSFGYTGTIASNISSQLTASSVTNGLNRLPWAIVNIAPNPYLRWEQTESANLGIDFATFNNRLRGAFDWYRKNTTDAFSEKRLDPSEGFTSQIINNASILNNGLEFSLDYSWFTPKVRSDFSWNTGVVFSLNKNKITYIDEVTTNPQALAEGDGYKIGNPVRAMYSYQYKGLDNVGQPQWIKADGNLTTISLYTGVDMEAMVYSGATDPSFNMSLTNDFSYKNFSLSIFAVYYSGHFLRSVAPTVTLPGYNPLPNYLLNSWTPDNTNTFIPGFGQYAPAQVVPFTQLINADLFVKKADFIKIRNVVLGYRLDPKLAHKLKVGDIRLSCQLNNPKALWTANAVNIDPETGGIPVVTSYVFGLNIKF